jgi:hypothetical protein
MQNILFVNRRFTMYSSSVGGPSDHALQAGSGQQDRSEEVSLRSPKKQNHEGPPGRAPSNGLADFGDSKISNHSAQLLGYGLLRALAGNPLKPRQIQLLQKGQRAADKARENLSFGRVNILDDIRQTGKEAAVRGLAARYVSNEYHEKKYKRLGIAVDSHEQSCVIWAVGGQLAQAGRCGEFGAQAFLHLAEEPLAVDEKIAKVEMPNAHGWAHILSASEKGVVGEVVVDPWASGPCVLTEDSTFAANTSMYEIKAAVCSPEHAKKLSKAFSAAKFCANSLIDFESHKDRAESNLEYGPILVDSDHPWPVIGMQFIDKLPKGSLSAINADTRGKALTVLKGFMPEMPKQELSQHTKQVIQVAQQLVGEVKSYRPASHYFMVLNDQ